MTFVPKPAKSKKKKSEGAPKLNEFEQLEIAEKLADALEFQEEITITTYRNKKYEKFTGIIRNADPNTKIITFDNGGLDHYKISANIIVDAN